MSTVSYVALVVFAIALVGFVFFFVSRVYRQRKAINILIKQVNTRHLANQQDQDSMAELFLKNNRFYVQGSIPNVKKNDLIVIENGPNSRQVRVRELTFKSENFFTARVHLIDPDYLQFARA